MSMEQLVEFLSKCDKRADRELFEEAKVKNNDVDEITATANMIADVGKTKGYSFTSNDVKQYMQTMKTEYYTSSTVRTLMDAFCTTSCHIGSQLQKA